MTISHNPCRYMRTLGMGKDATLAVLQQIEAWKRQSGPDWTIARLKLIKTNAIRQLAGLERVPSSWIAYKANGIPKGPIGLLFNVIPNLKGSKKRSIARLFARLSIYSKEVAVKPTRPQLDKFLNSVQRPTPIKTSSSMERFVNRSSFRLPEIRIANLGDIPFDGTRVPTSRFGSVSCRDIHIWIPDNAQSFLSMMSSILTDEDPWFEAARQMVTYGTTGMISRNGDQVPMQKWWYSHPPRPLVCGNIAFLQEPGYKLRAIANPNRIVQAYLKPLQQTLLGALKVIEADCTFEQQRGIDFVQEQLQRQKTVYAVDLSDATNNFPLDLQLRHLRSLWDVNASPVAHRQIDVFEQASRSKWQLPDKTLTRWEKGQPLGLAPSFPAFAFSHHLVMRKCGGTTDNYRILGDDVVIADSEVHRKYLDALEELGCPISKQKCLESKHVSEFAGKIITKDEVFASFKWRNLSDYNFIDVVRQLGQDLIQNLLPRQRKVAKALMDIPTFYGGLGFNPKGLTFLERLENPLIDKLLQNGGTPVRPNERIDRVLHGYLDLLGFREDHVLMPLPTRPESVLGSVLSVTGASSKIEEPIPRDLKPDVAIHPVKGRSQLETLESKLDLERPNRREQKSKKKGLSM